MNVPRKIYCGIVETGVSNLGAIHSMFRSMNIPTRCIVEPNEILSAPLLVLPGVGTLGQAMATLHAKALVDPLRCRVMRGQSLLCICLGMQMLFQGSEESPGVNALGIFPGVAKRFSSDVQCPQLGWNRVRAPQESAYVESGYAYFANSFRIVPSTTKYFDDIQLGRAIHGDEFVAFVERFGLLATQFHPELSGQWGYDVVARWVKRSVDLCS